MVYNFKAPAKSATKKTKKLFKKVKRIDYIRVNGIFIFLWILFLSFIGINIINAYTTFKLLDVSFFVLAVLCTCIAGFITSLCNIYADESRTYKKLSKELKFPVFVNAIHEQLAGEDAEIIDGIEIPELHINYDVNSNGKTAVLVKIDDDNYKIIHMLETDKVRKKAKTVVSSKALADGIRKMEEKGDMIIVRICCIHKENNGFVKNEDIDDAVVCEEAFLPIIYEE